MTVTHISRNDIQQQNQNLYLGSQQNQSQIISLTLSKYWESIVVAKVKYMSCLILVLPLVAMLVCSCVNMNGIDKSDTLFISECYNGNYDIEGREYSINRLMENIKLHKVKRILLLEDKVDNGNDNNARLIRFCHDNNICIYVRFATSMAIEDIDNSTCCGMIDETENQSSMNIEDKHKTSEQ